MKVAVTGSAGLLGKNLVKELSKNYEVAGISRRACETVNYVCDLSENRSKSILDEINPQIIVHAAAMTNVEKCEISREEAYKNNVLATRQIAQWAANKKRKLIYISTDYIYPGITNNYDENSDPSPLNYYGITKLEGEIETKKVEDHLILRPTGIFGYDADGLNFLMQMLALSKKRKIPFDKYGNPTDVKLLCEYIEKSIESNLRGEYLATGPETINRYEFSKLIFKVFNLDEKIIEPACTSELKFLAARPLYNGSNSNKLRKELGCSAISLEESLQKIRDNK